MVSTSAFVVSKIFCMNFVKKPERKTTYRYYDNRRGSHHFDLSNLHLRYVENLHQEHHTYIYTLETSRRHVQIICWQAVRNFTPFTVSHTLLSKKMPWLWYALCSALHRSITSVVQKFFKVSISACNFSKYSYNQKPQWKEKQTKVKDQTGERIPVYILKKAQPHLDVRVQHWFNSFLNFSYKLRHWEWPSA